MESNDVIHSRVLYVGQSSNLAKRWQNHNLWKVVKYRSNSLCLAWLECDRGEEVRRIIEAAFIQSLEPELNQDRVHVWMTLGWRGWDRKAAEKDTWILGKQDKTQQEKEIFVSILQELVSESNKLQPSFISE